VGEGSRWEARVGELAVYPGQGVALIEALRTEEIAGQKREFLVLRKIEDDARILIPRENIEQVGLRGVIGPDEAERIWSILKVRTRRRRASGLTWSRQFRAYQDKLRTGSIFEVAEVLRDLMRLQTVKELSFGERRVLDSARSLLVQELAASESVGTDQIDDQINAVVR
jgi:CarD family transcriptional regulator